MTDRDMEKLRRVMRELAEEHEARVQHDPEALKVKAEIEKVLAERACRIHLEEMLPKVAH